MNENYLLGILADLKDTLDNKVILTEEEEEMLAKTNKLINIELDKLQGITLN